MPNNESIVLGGGCFWCTEAVFRRAKGVLSVVPGYAGGHTKHPTYDDVCTGQTGHAEVIQVTFDPTQISLEDLLTIFLAAHDPTSLHRQGADEGTQYRSIILWENEKQRTIVEKFLEKAQARFPQPIVTEVQRSDAFTPAEISHREYYEKNPDAAYCSVVIAPKLEKLRGLLKSSQEKA